MTGRLIACWALLLCGLFAQSAAGQWDSSWEGIASPAQVIGMPTVRDQPQLGLGLGVNTSKDEAQLYIDPADLQRISNFTIRCGIAGAVGPVIWQGSLGADQLTSVIVDGTLVHFRAIDGRELVPTLADSSCGTVINNIASLQAAARQRRVYVEMESEDVVIRGQLWPKQTFTGLHAQMSDQQVVGGRDAPIWQRRVMDMNIVDYFYNDGAPEWYLRSLAYASYSAGVPYPYSEGVSGSTFRSLTLYCGPAGVNGEIVASLAPQGGELTSLDLFPTQATGPCGMAINNIASLVEATARGNLYVVGELIDPAGHELRGQFDPIR